MLRKRADVRYILGAGRAKPGARFLQFMSRRFDFGIVRERGLNCAFGVLRAVSRIIQERKFEARIDRQPAEIG
jgi:hypothetical protein